MNKNLNNLKNRSILIVGDVMLDTYHMGDVKRISPEAPVPVVHVKRTYSVLGGAANVARNLLGLECCPVVIGLRGDDHNGLIMEDMFDQLHIRHTVLTSLYPTITKTRVVGNNQQVVRLDFETPVSLLDEDTEQQLLNAIDRALPEAELVVISDYGKGVCNATLCQHIIRQARALGKAVIIDPKGSDWDKYRQATVITPNLKELSVVAGCDVRNENEAVHPVADRILRAYQLDSLLVTRSEKGMSYVSPRTSLDIPTEAREVYDVSGAGDTVVATLAAAMAAGFAVEDALFLANKAAGVVVGKIGTSPILYKELSDQLGGTGIDGKIVRRDHLPELIKDLRNKGRRIVFTNGCFDILHRGHVTYLNKARQLGDVLILGLNSDESVHRLKGPTRPVNDEQSRAFVMAALEAVDYVVIFGEDTPHELIRVVAPDVLVKGGDYKIEDIVGREFAKETVTIPFVDGFSTTQTIEKMKQ